MSPTVPQMQLQQGHFVEFYEGSESLVADVSEFLEAGLRAGQVALLIATEAHRNPVCHRLAQSGALSVGSDHRRLIILDAQATLDRFMRDGLPDERLFLASMGQLFDEISGGGRRQVSAFGEMVAVLCAEGQYDAALRLEQLWNELASRHSFSLMCAYPMRLFAGSDQAERFHSFCAEHAHVRPAGTESESTNSSGPTSAGPTGLPFALLQQKAASLDAEVDRRRRAEATLMQREWDLADFLENAAEGIHRVAADGTILWANRAELDMLGYAPDEYVGHQIAEFHVDRPVLDRIMRKLRDGQTLYDEPARLRCRNGDVKHVLIQSNALFHAGKLVYTRCFMRDVTDRVVLAETRRERNSLLMKAPVAAALLTGPTHVFRLANPAWCAMMGVCDVIGRGWRDLDGKLPESAIGVVLDQVYCSGEAFAAPEYRMLVRGAEGHADERFLRLNLEPLKDGGGSVYGIMLLADEVTDQVKARRALEASHRERKRLLEEVEAASRAKDEFLAMLGHELRNPLSPIVTALQLMKMRGDARTSREQEIIRRQVTHLTRLVDDLLDVSRITGRQIELRTESVEIAEPVMKAIEMASPLLEQRSHLLSIDMPASGLPWEGDPVRLAQVLSNLLTNAARYTDPGGRIELKGSREQEWIRISVRDNGRGISAEVLPHVFDLFYQGKRTVEKAAGGLGLGLALVRSLVEMHGGRVEALSDGPGKGSEFVLRLPVRSSAGKPDCRMSPQAASSQPRRTPASLRVLIVDDNEDAGSLLGNLLVASGHVARVVHDPAAALAVAGEFAPDLALLDIGLPVMDGYELAGALRNRLGPALRLVALTGYGREADRQKSAQAGFERHLVKPVDHADLLALLAEPSACLTSSVGTRS